MTRPLHILIVEDSEDDAMLLLRELDKGGYDVTSRRVETEEELRSSLAAESWDLVVSDYVLPRFSGTAALQVLKQSGLDLPFIIVSGNIGEEIAVEAMKAGAHDYLMKGNLKRLVPAVERELEEAGVRRKRRRAETDLVRLNRLYAVLSSVNEAIVRKRDRRELFAEVCRIIVETGAFRLAWVGILDAATRIVRTVASHGATAYLDGLTVVADDVPEGKGPTGRAIVEKRHVINLDFETNQRMAPWRERARASGIRSSSAFPLCEGDRAVGALTIYSEQPHFFTDEEISLLTTLANNLSYAMESIGTEQMRQAAEANLLASYREVEDLYNNAPCGYHSLDRDGTIARINNTELAWLGYTREEVVGRKKITDFYTPAGVANFHETYPQFMRQGSVTSFEVDLVRRAGSVMRVLLSATAVRDNEGNFLMSRSTLFDITERKAAERRSRVSNELFNLFARKITRREYLDAVCKVIGEWSGCRSVGIRVEDRPGVLSFAASRGYDDSFLEEEGALSLASDRCICMRIVVGRAAPSELELMTPGGSFVSGDAVAWQESLPPEAKADYRGACMRSGYRSLAVIPIRYRDRVTGVIHLADELDNIVTRRDAEFLEQIASIIGEALYRFGVEEERMRLASAVESTADAVVITEPKHGLIQYVNSAFERTTGYPRNEVIGRDQHVLDSGRQGRAFYEDVRDSLARDGAWHGRMVSRKKDGTFYFEDCTISAVRDMAGDPINYVSIRRDVTDRLKLESIAESVSMLDNIGAVFAGVRHEIGNPVNTIKTLLAVLDQKLDTAPPERTRNYIARAITEIGRVEQLLNTLRTFNLFETPVLVELDTAPLLEQLGGLVREDLEAKGIDIFIQTLPGAERVRADARALQHVLLNLVTNAADALAGRELPRIDVTLSRDADRVRFRVSDNGRGMTEDQLRNLFRPFNTTKVHGTGLGLVIIRKMVTSMHGTIEIESSTGSGTIATVWLPGGNHAA